jgi:hypothetical protein
MDRRGFRWRGTEVNRVEALSDAVFGFAITLLVVSLEVPRTYDQLAAAMRGFFAFAVCFALLFLVWFHQYRFFRRYGLQDNTTIWLNAALLFTVVFFVYPLKFVFGWVFGRMLGEPSTVRLADGTLAEVLRDGQGGQMMVVYSAGWVAVFLVFALLHLHAWRMRGALQLTPLETHDTLDNVRESLLNIAIGLVSIAIALRWPENGGMAGLVYWLIGPSMGIHGVISGRARQRLAARLAAAGSAPT